MRILVLVLGHHSLKCVLTASVLPALVTFMSQNSRINTVREKAQVRWIFAAGLERCRERPQFFRVNR